MSRRKFTVDWYKEIERLLAAGRGVREIARAAPCARCEMTSAARQNSARWSQTRCG
jgi:hypothetical protein